MADEIIEFLENDKLRQKVIKTIQSVWSYAVTLYDNPEEDMEEYVEKTAGSSLWEEAWWRAEVFGELDEIEEAFYKYVIQKMAKPYRLTLEELVETFLDLAKPDERHYIEFESFDSGDCNKLYTIFINHIKNHILSHRSSDPFPVCLVAEVPDAKDVEEEKPLWSKNGISVSLLRGADVIGARPAGKKLYRILAFIEGNISASACRNLQGEMSRIIPTTIRSTDLLQATGFGERKLVEPTISLVFEREIEGLPWGEENLLENGKPLIRQYLDAYYSGFTGKKDSIDRRIRNAVCLLIESDNQLNNAVGLALSVTAIDALLGEKGPEAFEKLADRVGALLEPDTSQRYNASEFVKGLCTNRSDALHGREVETERAKRFNARHLAAAVLSAVVSRRDFLRRADYEPETPKELLKDLRKDRFAPGQPMGVPEFNIRELWRKKSGSL